jgi:hypothetical protein
MFEEHFRMPDYQWQAKEIPRLIIDQNPHFDPLAAIFFLLSRVEEYTPTVVDLHGRFPATASSNYAHLLMPLADIWRKELLEALGIEITQSKRKTKFSFDIDSAYAYRHKGLKRTLGAIGRDFITLQIQKCAERILCIAGILHDPFDTYDKIVSDCESAGAETIWFFLLSDRTGENNNIHHGSKGLRNLIQTLSRKYAVGIHPGYDTWKSSNLLEKETDRLHEIIGTRVLHSRQHYLRFTLPETYKLLLETSIRHEYSMGYADAPGFRAGTSRPFMWFDLSRNQVTELMVHPFCAMDVTFSRYQKYSVDESISLIRQMREYIQTTHGEFHMLWHNETLSEREPWRGWSALWDQVLNDTAPERDH